MDMIACGCKILWGLHKIHFLWGPSELWRAGRIQWSQS